MKKLIFTFYILLSSVVCFSQDSERGWFTGVSLKMSNGSYEETNVDNVIYPERRSNCYIQFYGGKQILKRLDLGFFTEFSRDYFFYNSNPSVETIRLYEYVDVIGGSGVPAHVQKDWSENYLSYALSLRYHLVVGKKIGLDLAFNPGMQTRFNVREEYEIERNEFDEEVVVLNKYNSRTTYRFFRSTLGLNYDVNSHWRIRFIQDLMVNNRNYLTYLWDSNGPYFALEYRF